ncbi:hypothetical protein HR060_12770 [Catenovulum sp. SM1970]|uniref:hypothetical protein n=1 Tax=Marinifaba aquimaris TaxID=2741323 RepID=UPI001574AA84|nr:hypothetical protein [Marinifaba aquimaris]NTS77734.1 hypothetical protein [Marinifaba aquimaris]
MKTLITAIALMVSTTAFAEEQITRVIDLKSKNANYAALFTKFDTVLVKSTIANKQVKCSVKAISNGNAVESQQKQVSQSKFERKPLAACLNPSQVGALVDKA